MRTLVLSIALFLAWTGAAVAASVVGSAGPDTLVGTPTADPLYGLAGDDLLVGLDGDDDFDGGPGADLFRGGSGTDAVSYASRSTSVMVTFDGRANDGEAGEADNISADVEDAFGGEGPDTLIGNGAANLLDGAGGADFLSGGPGADLLFGGPGDDEIQVRDGIVDVVECGPGSDRAALDTDDLASDCEYTTTRVADAALTYDWVEQGGRVRFRVLELAGVKPRGEAAVRLTCTGGACAAQSVRPDRRDRAPLLARLKRRDLAVGTVVTIEVSAREALGKRWRLTVRRRAGRTGAEVVRTVECVWPGEKRVRPCS